MAPTAWSMILEGTGAASVKGLLQFVQSTVVEATAEPLVSLVAKLAVFL